MRYSLTLPRQTVFRPPLRDLPSRERSVFAKRLLHHFHGTGVDLRSESEFLMSPPELADHRRPHQPKYPAHVLRRQQVQRAAHRPRPHHGAVLHSRVFDIIRGHTLSPDPHGQRLGKRVLGLYRRDASHDIRYAD